MAATRATQLDKAYQADTTGLVLLSGGDDLPPKMIAAQSLAQHVRSSRSERTCVCITTKYHEETRRLDDLVGKV